MASYYPEGECFFVRSSLQYAGNWSAENIDQFYTHVLLEYDWNGWVTINQTSSDRPHPRSKLESGRGAWWRTTFCDWDRFFVGESIDKNPDNMLAITSHPNSLNWNECRDLDSGGPRKYILRPVKIRDKNTKWLWIDATIPLRAIYFPVAHKTDEAFPNFCTYVVIDFKARETIEISNLVGEYQKVDITRERGLGLRDDLTWGFKVPDIITYLAIPPKLRNPEHGLFRSATPGDELFVCAWSGRTWNSPFGTLHAEGFYREIDLANILSATFGVEVGWRPYQFSSFILDLVLHATELALGFIPGAGPLISVAFGMGVQLLQDPDSFRAENVLDITAAVLETLIESSTSSRRFIAPDIFPTSSSSTRATYSALTEEQLARRKQLGDEINAGLNERLGYKSVIVQSFARVRNDSTESVHNVEGAERNEEQPI